MKTADVPRRAMTMVQPGPNHDNRPKAYSVYNDQPGTGKTGMYEIPPNNYPFYSEEEKYKPQHGIDGGFLSEWEPLYEASTVKADADKLKAFQSGVPVGSKYEPTGTKSWAPVFENAERKLLNKYKDKGGEELDMLVVSDLHRHEEYGGPFWIKVPSTARVREVRLVISEKCGILPGLQRMSYGGKQMEDAERKLEHYGVKYWNKKFPDWPLYIRRY